MNDPLTFRQTSHHTIKRTKLSNAMCRYEHAWNILYSCISVGGVCSVEFIGITYHVQTIYLVDVVEKLEIEVTRNALAI